MRAGQIFVGPSGWSYRSWSETVARGVRLEDRLALMARLFNAVEVNGSHYRQIATATYEKWAAQTPPTFRFAVKGHRYVTHFRRLSNCDDPIRRLRDQASGLGDKLSCVVWQLPASFSKNLARLDDFLRALRAWDDTRHALEVRHPSWFDDEVHRRLADARVASCLSDAPDFPLWRAVTTDLVYVRLHGHTRKYASSYSSASLARWADEARAWAAEGRDVHLYLDNDAEGAALANAGTLMRVLALRAAAPVPTSSARPPRGPLRAEETRRSRRADRGAPVARRPRRAPLGTRRRALAVRRR
ncbi:MAG: hypothetical protein JWM82_2061 [Myxococcales bacterium]|nr:hypothetical protein [Myxococcales bacterium]